MTGHSQENDLLKLGGSTKVSGFRSRYGHYSHLVNACAVFEQRAESFNLLATGALKPEVVLVVELNVHYIDNSSRTWQQQ